MATGFALNPFLTTNSAGLFAIDSTGFIQGCTMDSPDVRNHLAGGIVALTETAPMYGGMAITEALPTGYVSGTAAGPKALGGPISRATAIGGAMPITGFTVVDQAYHGIAAPQSPVPQFLQGTSVHFYRLGDKARIPLKCDPALINLQGGLITQQVSWDFVNQQVIAYSAAAGALPIRVLEVAPTNCITYSIDTTTGFATFNRNGSCILALI